MHLTTIGDSDEILMIPEIRNGKLVNYPLFFDNQRLCLSTEHKSYLDRLQVLGPILDRHRHTHSKAIVVGGTHQLERIKNLPVEYLLALGGAKTFNLGNQKNGTARHIFSSLLTQQTELILDVKNDGSVRGLIFENARQVPLSQGSLRTLHYIGETSSIIDLGASSYRVSPPPGAQTSDWATKLKADYETKKKILDGFQDPVITDIDGRINRLSPRHGAVTWFENGEANYKLAQSLIATVMSLWIPDFRTNDHFSKLSDVYFAYRLTGYPARFGDQATHAFGDAPGQLIAALVRPLMPFGTALLSIANGSEQLAPRSESFLLSQFEEGYAPLHDVVTARATPDITSAHQITAATVFLHRRLRQLGLEESASNALISPVVARKRTLQG